MAVEDTPGRIPLVKDGAVGTEATQSTEQLPIGYDAVALEIIDELGSAGGFQVCEAE